MLVNSRLTATKTIGQRKAFYRQGIPESSCVRKKTVDIDMLVSSRNSDRKTFLEDLKTRQNCDNFNKNLYTWVFGFYQL